LISAPISATFAGHTPHLAGEPTGVLVGSQRQAFVPANINFEQTPMLKTMFVLVVISGQYYPAPVVISQHSTLEKCEQAYKDFTVRIARNTSHPGVTTTVMRTYACTETEVWLSGRVE
jgi:hypothetical protein